MNCHVDFGFFCSVLFVHDGLHTVIALQVQFGY